MKNKKIVIAGGTGFIGRNVAKHFGNENEIVILTRNVKGEKNNAYGPANTNTITKNTKLVEWAGKNTGGWIKEIDGCDVVINLSGKSVNCRYTTKNKKEIFDS
ncbi:MAG TPA: NAD-dependent epimerase/dehydratase family protein [Segetibacter sp.]|jgi:hypothetical protein